VYREESPRHRPNLCYRELTQKQEKKLEQIDRWSLSELYENRADSCNERRTVGLRAIDEGAKIKAGADRFQWWDATFGTHFAYGANRSVRKLRRPISVLGNQMGAPPWDTQKKMGQIVAIGTRCWSHVEIKYDEKGNIPSYHFEQSLEKGPPKMLTIEALPKGARTTPIAALEKAITKTAQSESRNGGPGVYNKTIEEEAVSTLHAESPPLMHSSALTWLRKLPTKNDANFERELSELRAFVLKPADTPAG
jgi:hypothetical protein